MSLEAWGDGPDFEPMFDEKRVEEAFRDGLRACREYMARFVEQGGDTTTANSIRANWNPWWGADEGALSGDLLVDPWGNTQRDMERSRERLRIAMEEAYRDSDRSGEAGETGTGSAEGDGGSK